MRIWEFKEGNSGFLTAPDGFSEAAVNGRAVALGYFDGVHMGHRQILNLLKKSAGERSIPSMVHTFSSLPKSKSEASGVKEGSLLTTLSEKCSCFARLGMDETAIFPFSEKVASLHAMEFLQHYIKDLLHAKVIVAGEDYRFGQNRGGDMELLSFWGHENGIEVFAVPPVRHNNQIISSTWIRECIRSGRITTANLLLGYTVSYQGVVQHGRHLGRTLGFPTANINIEGGKVIPAYGVYASVLLTNDVFYHAVTSIGLRPTVNTSETVPIIETMVYDHTLDIYDQKIQVFLLSFIRPEHRFPDINHLKDQVKKDMDEVRDYHNLHGSDYSNLL